MDRLEHGILLADIGATGSAHAPLKLCLVRQDISREIRKGDDLEIGTALGVDELRGHDIDEDHSFIVLEGEAAFRIESDDNVKVVGRYEGVMLPKGVNYWFQSSGEQNLVMVRVGATYPGHASGRLTPEGRDIPGDSPENKTVERIERSGPGFGG